MIAGDRNHPKPDVIHISDVQPGDYFYICSDGMLEQMEDEELLDVFYANVSDEEKRQMLISETSDNKDNHSSYIVHIKEVSHDEADVSLVNEEPTAKCNALNIKPDVEEMTASPDVEIVKPAGTPPPLPDSVRVAMEDKQKRKKHLFVAFIVIVALAVVGMFGYGYYTKHNAEAKSFMDTVLVDSIQENREESLAEKDSLPQDTAVQQLKGTSRQNNEKITKNGRNK